MVSFSLFWHFSKLSCFRIIVIMKISKISNARTEAQQLRNVGKKKISICWWVIENLQEHAHWDVRSGRSTALTAASAEFIGSQSTFEILTSLHINFSISGNVAKKTHFFHPDSKFSPEFTQPSIARGSSEAHAAVDVRNKNKINRQSTVSNLSSPINM